MNMLFIAMSLLVRFLLFFVVVRNIARNRACGWGVRDYGGMVLIALILVYSWFSSFGAVRVVIMLFLAGTIVTAAFEGLGMCSAG